MKLSEELLWRGFHAETTIKDPSTLDEKSRKFYLGADPSADSLTIGNLAALMMCACFARHGYEPHLLVGGATGQIGDPKETGERDLKSLDEIEHNKQCIAAQMQRIVGGAQVHDNINWFSNMNYLTFLREIGKNFSMTQLLDRQFIQARIGEGGSGISYAEFSYTLIQGYDFYHLYKEYGIDLQLCGADQYGNCASGLHLIRTLSDGQADIWSTPLIIDPVTGRKFGKSEGNAIWLAATDNGSGNFTPVFDYYQFWLGQSDQAVESLLKVYTTLSKEEIDDILTRHAEHPEQRIAQKALALGSTSVVHGVENAEKVAKLTEMLFNKDADLDLTLAAEFLPHATPDAHLLDVLVSTGVAASKNEARGLLKAGAISLNGEKLSLDSELKTGLLKKGKNKFVVIK